MADLDAAILYGTLRFASARLQALVTTIAPDPDALLTELLGQSPSAQQQAELAGVAASVQTDLTSATAASNALSAGLAAVPADISGLTPASGHLNTALTSVGAAVATISGAVSGAPNRAPGLETLMRSAIVTVSEQFGGLVEQFVLAPAGTASSSALQVQGTIVRYRLTNPATRTLEGGLFTLRNSEFNGSIDWTTPNSLRVRLETDVIAGLIADEFVQKLLPVAASADVKLVVTDDLADGITFGSGVKHRIALPGQINLPGVEVRDFAFELPKKSELSGTSTPPAFELTATIAGGYGPVKAVVDGLGVQMLIDANSIVAASDPPATMSVRPPTGGGLSIDAGPVRGGGYVSHKGNEYGGVLQLAIGPIEIKAIGLISTEPFSLVLVLSVEFNPGIQLSFGFTLNGVGGLLALERTVSTDALRASFRRGTLDGLLFPKDPVSAAPQILRTLSDSFPPDPGSFVVGPMLAIGWGAPVSLVVAKLGVLLALPDPKIIIIGAVRVALPTPDAAIIDLKAELYGEITPEHILLLVSLNGSKVAGFSINGDFGILIGFGNNPEFALTAGGFHPSYKPPAELKGMSRVSVDLSPPAIVTLRADAYFALTSNSFQLGASVQIGADVGVAGAEGHLSFDAIIRWAPRFAFEIDLSAGISLYVFGISFASVELSAHLEGPGPWVIHGTASVSLLFFDFDFEVGPITWGEGDNPPPESVSPVLLVAEALRKPNAWQSVAPEQGDRVASLADATPVPGTVLVHPLGGLEVREKIVPLETTIDKVGGHPVSERRVNLANPLIGSLPPKAVSHTTDRFASGQFLELTDDQKLSRPAFENFPSGMRLSGVSGDSFGTPVESTYQWETVYPQRDLPRLKEPVFFDSGLKATVLSVGPAALSAGQVEHAYAVDRPGIALSDSGTVRIRNTQDLGMVANIPTVDMTTTAAERIIAEAIAADPSKQETVQMVGLGVGA